MENGIFSSVADPYFESDPVPILWENADPDPTLENNADSGPVGQDPTPKKNLDSQHR